MTERSLLSHQAQILRNFSCQKSGNCCRAPGYVYVTTRDITLMAEKLGLPEDEFRRSYVRRVKGWEVIAAPDFRPGCFLDAEHRCRVYEVRPQACRTYPHWPQIWASEDALRNELAQCPGLRRAVAQVVDNS